MQNSTIKKSLRIVIGLIALAFLMWNFPYAKAY